MMRIKLNSINADPFSVQGIFQKIQSLNAFTWLTEDMAKSMDIEYYLGYSGDKWISPLYSNLIELNTTTPTIDVLTELAKIIIMKYGDNWNKLYDAFISADYDPIQNYSMEEDESTDFKSTSTGKTSNDVYGFNSSTGTPSSDTDVNNVVTGTSDDNKRHLERSGNIGVTTNQQMIESELELRKKNFCVMLYNNTDEILTLSIY